uniref:Uncharacterized protein n=1 Tax=Haemonchus contortus TaxID=6289 RepID=A0A7I4Z525_HAECO
MPQYGDVGNLSQFRERTTSPAYSHLGKHKDDYNRFETAMHAAAKWNERQKSEESRFQAFGDRLGSGVEMSTHHWQGGEIITDPTQLPKSLKPRRLYYSPIGDGTVAADGIELRRRPVDLSPRVTITQMTHLDRGQKGHDGLYVYEKTWKSSALSRPESETGCGSEQGGGGGSGRNSRADVLNLTGVDSHEKNDCCGKKTTGIHGGSSFPIGYGVCGSTGVGVNDTCHAPLSRVIRPGAPGDGWQGRAIGDMRGGPYNAVDSLGTQTHKSNEFLGPGNDGRISAASSMFSDPICRFDTKTGYLITNPRELIHQYATTTPVAVMEANDNTPAITTASKQGLCKKAEQISEEWFSPYAPYKTVHNVPSPNRFTHQLRDETMTRTQHEANTHVEPFNQRDPRAQKRINEIRTKTHDIRSGQDEIDNLTQQLLQGLHTSSLF